MNMNKKTLLLSFLCLFLTIGLAAQESYKPSGTYLFSTKDGQELYMDDTFPLRAVQPNWTTKPSQR